MDNSRISSKSMYSLNSQNIFQSERNIHVHNDISQLTRWIRVWYKFDLFSTSVILSKIVPKTFYSLFQYLMLWMLIAGVGPPGIVLIMWCTRIIHASSSTTFNTTFNTTFDQLINTYCADLHILITHKNILVFSLHR